MKALNRHGCYRIWYIVYNLLISYLLQYKYLHFIEILDEIIEEIYQRYTIVDEFVEKPILIEEIMK